MTHLLTRLREWVIRKLGSYTSRTIYTLADPYPFLPRTVHPMRISSTYSIHRCGLARSSDYAYAMQFARKQIAARIAEEMLRGNCIDFSSQQLPAGHVVVQGTVLVYSNHGDSPFGPGGLEVR